MGDLRVQPVVEGHGEVEAVGVLLRRLWGHLGGRFIDVKRPIRRPRSNLVQEGELRLAIELAALKLNNETDGCPSAILLLLDADENLPCDLAPKLLEIGRRAAGSTDFFCVLPNPEYETWFVAAAESLVGLADESGDVPSDPEWARSKKAWVKSRLGRYSETVDQPRLTHAMDLDLCRSRSASFRKLCRELEARISEARPGTGSPSA